jgi:hypothetical protein
MGLVLREWALIAVRLPAKSGDRPRAADGKLERIPSKDV